MDLVKNVKEKTVTITKQDMITIPSVFMKMYGLKDGDKVLILEDEGTLKIIPLKDEQELRKNSYTMEEMLKQMEKSKKKERIQEESNLKEH